MASKIDETTNIRFLLSCITHCDGRVDIQKVGEEFGLKSSAASMRLTRLKQAHGYNTPGSGSKKRYAADNATEVSATPSKRSKKKQQVASHSDDNSYAFATGAEGVEIDEVDENDNVLEHNFKQEKDVNH